MPRTLVRLSDADVAHLVTAPPAATATQLARELRAPYFTVAKALARIRASAGWVCRLSWAPCTECGRPVAGPPNARSHPACRSARAGRYSRERRAAGRVMPSTPYVAAWRATNPDADRALRERDKARRRERFPDLPLAVREATIARVHAADRRDQPLTAEHADNSGDVWSDDDYAMLDAHSELPARDLALLLGRTLHAVRTRRKLRRRQVERGEQRAAGG